MQYMRAYFPVHCKLSWLILAALSIHHCRRGSNVVASQREVHTLKMKLQEIMKGNDDVSSYCE